MSEEAQVVEAVEVPNRRTVVSSENASEFYANKLGLAAETPSEAEESSEPEAQQTEGSEPEAEKDTKATEERKPNPKLEKRFSELTKQREAARQEAQREREQREALEARLQALEQSAQPRASAIDEEPQPHQFSDAFEYAKALAEYSAEKAVKERDRQEAEKQLAVERQKVVEAWAKKVEAAKAEMPDFEEMIESSDVVVSDPIRDAIVESDVGPQILYYLAENPEVADKLAAKSVTAAMRELGKLEARFEKEAETSSEKPSKTVVKKSNAPAPIKPLKATSSAADMPIDSEGQFHGTFQQWKAARLAGKIR